MSSEIAFGDRVRVVATPATIESGFSGAEGDVYGSATPSITGGDVGGGAPDDHARYLCRAVTR